MDKVGGLIQEKREVEVSSRLFSQAVLNVHNLSLAVYWEQDGLSLYG